MSSFALKNLSVAGSFQIQLLHYHLLKWMSYVNINTFSYHNSFASIKISATTTAHNNHLTATIVGILSKEMEDLLKKRCVAHMIMMMATNAFGSGI